MAKKANSNTPSKKSPNLDSNGNEKNQRVSLWLEDYQDLFSLKTRPVTQGFIERLAHELIEWAKKPDSLVVKDFYNEKHIGVKTFYRWIDKYPEMAAANEYALNRLSSKREIGGLTRKFDPTFAWNSLPKYDPEWREFMQWKSSLKQSEDNQQKIVVEINDLSKAKSE